MSGLKTTKVVGRFLRIKAEFADGCDVAELSMLPGGRTIILGCVDPRVDPAAVLGLRLGEAVVIRNIGGRITQATIRTLALLAAIARSGGTEPGGNWSWSTTPTAASPGCSTIPTRSPRSLAPVQRRSTASR